MLQTIVAGILALAPILGLIASWLKANADQATGAQLQAGATAATVAQTETAIAQAEAAAPTTRQAVVDRLKQGTF